MENIQKSASGYYGWTGTSVIFDGLLKMFKQQDIIEYVQPISYTDFVQFVLVPETALCLIAQDKGYEVVDDNLETLLFIYNDSCDFGKIVHDDIKEEEFLGCVF